MRFLFTGLTLLTLLLSCDRAWANERVDLELVLALDASSSVDAREYELQLSGVAQGLRDPSVLAAIAAGPFKQIAVNVVIWARPSDNKQTSGWSVIGSVEDAEAFAARLTTMPRMQNGGTGIGEGITAALFELRTSPYKSDRRVIDVSGDGRETFARREADDEPILLPESHALADKMNVTINGLAITGDEVDLLSYFNANVRHGPGSFAIEAKSYEDFARAMKKKLLREISAQPVAMRMEID